MSFFQKNQAYVPPRGKFSSLPANASKSGEKARNSGAKSGGVWGKNTCCTNATKNTAKFCHIDKLIFRRLNVIIHISKNIFYHADSR